MAKLEDRWSKLICDCCGKRAVVRGGFLIGKPYPTHEIKLCEECVNDSGYVWDEGDILIDGDDKPNEQDLGIIQGCIERLDSMASAFDVLGLGVAANEINDVSYLVRKVFENTNAGEEQVDD